MSGGNGDQRRMGAGNFRNSDGSKTRARWRWLRDRRPRCKRCRARLRWGATECTWKCQRAAADRPEDTP